MRSPITSSAAAASSSSGSAAPTALMILTLLGIAASSVRTAPGKPAEIILRDSERAALRSRLLDGLDETVSALRADPTPYSDASSDPVWTVVDKGTSHGDTLILTDISSALNINSLAARYLREDAVRTQYTSFSAPGIIADHLDSKGPYLSPEDASDVIPEKDENRFFTVWGLWNPAIGDLSSLSALIRARSGGRADAEELAISLIAASQAPRGERTKRTAAVLGNDPYDLSALLTTRGTINVHFANAELISAILDFKYGGKSLPEKTRARNDLLFARIVKEVSPTDLESLIEREEGQDEVLSLLGTTTWFWEIRLNAAPETMAGQNGTPSKGGSLTVILARLPAMNENGTAVFRVISRRFEGAAL